MPIKSFQEIHAWQKSHVLALEVYNVSSNCPKHELFGLVSQSRRAAVSVPSNIAEGFRRLGKADRLHFYNIAQASLEELRYQLLLACDLKYISVPNYDRAIAKLEEASKTLNGWVKSQKFK